MEQETKHKATWMHSCFLLTPGYLFTKALTLTLSLTHTFKAWIREFGHFLNRYLFYWYFVLNILYTVVFLLFFLWHWSAVWYLWRPILRKCFSKTVPMSCSLLIGCLTILQEDSNTLHWYQLKHRSLPNQLKHRSLPNQLKHG